MGQTATAKSAAASSKKGETDSVELSGSSKGKRPQDKSTPGKGVDHNAPWKNEKKDEDEVQRDIEKKKVVAEGKKKKEAKDNSQKQKDKEAKEEKERMDALKKRQAAAKKRHQMRLAKLIQEKIAALKAKRLAEYNKEVENRVDDVESLREDGERQVDNRHTERLLARKRRQEAYKANLVNMQKLLNKSSGKSSADVQTRQMIGNMMAMGALQEKLEGQKALLQDQIESLQSQNNERDSEENNNALKQIEKETEDASPTASEFPRPHDSDRDEELSLDN